VSLTVDTRARDSLKVWEVLARNKESRVSPARQWINSYRSSTLTVDSHTEWDEIGGVLDAGVKCKGGKWTVFPVVAGQEGTIARLRVITEPAREFAVAVFGHRIYPARLSGISANPLTKEGRKAWSSQAAQNTLDKHLLLYVAGTEEQPLGYWPGTKKGDDGATGDPLTGKWRDDASFGYRTFATPVLWVAMYVVNDTTIKPGRIMWNQMGDTL